jgi:HMG box factor
VVEKNPGMANPEISKVIGEQWRQLSEEEKGKWKALAEVSIPFTCFGQFSC